MRLTNPEASFASLERAVNDARTEQRAVNEVVRKLAALGYARAAHPEVHASTVDRATLRFYLWRDTPFDDDIVLSTGPSFQSKVAMGRSIPSTAGVGFYVQSILAEKTRALEGAGRAAARSTRAAPAPKPAKAAAPARAAAPRKVPAVRTRKAAAAPAPAPAPAEPTFYARGGMAHAAKAMAAERAASAAAAEAQREALAAAKRLEAEAKSAKDREAADAAGKAKKAAASFLKFLEEAE